MINSVRSRAPQTNNKVSGLSAVTANNPSPPTASVPAQVSEFVKFGRATAVRRTESVSAAILNAYGQESPLARKEIGLLNNATGFHNCSDRALVCVCKTKTLPSARIAPPIATSQTYREDGW